MKNTLIFVICHTSSFTIKIAPTNFADESPKQLQKQTTKWKRDRKSRLPEYSRKSDPKFQETFNLESTSDTNGGTDIVDISNHTYKNGCSNESISRSSNGTGSMGSYCSVDTPLDMSVRQRGLPPSYSQTVNSPSYRSTSRAPSLITQNGDSSLKEEIPSGLYMIINFIYHVSFWSIIISLILMSRVLKWNFNRTRTFLVEAWIRLIRHTAQD